MIPHVAPIRRRTLDSTLRRPVEDFRLRFAYALMMGEMKRANARKAEKRQRNRFASTLVIAAAIIAAVWLV